MYWSHRAGEILWRDCTEIETLLRSTCSCSPRPLSLSPEAPDVVEQWQVMPSVSGANSWPTECVNIISGGFTAVGFGVIVNTTTVWNRCQFSLTSMVKEERKKLPNGRGTPSFHFINKLGEIQVRKILWFYGYLDVLPGALEVCWDGEPFTMVEKTGMVYERGSVSSNKGLVLGCLKKRLG